MIFQVSLILGRKSFNLLTIIIDTRRIKGLSINYLLMNTTRLQHLNLNGLPNIADDTVIALAQSPAASVLKSIHMIGVHTGLTEQVVDVLANRTTSLTDLSLGMITRSPEIIELCTNTMTGTIKQIGDGLSKLANLAPKLKTLTLKGKFN